MSQPNSAPQPKISNENRGLKEPAVSEEDLKWFAQAKADGFVDTIEEYLAMKEEARLLREDPDSLPPGKSTAEVLAMLNSLP